MMMKTRTEVLAMIRNLRSCKKDKGELDYNLMAYRYGTEGVVSTFNPAFMEGFLSGLEYAYKENLTEEQLEDHWRAIQETGKLTMELIGERNAYGFVLDYTMPKPKGN